MLISVRAVDFVLTHAVRGAVEERLACALAWTGRQTARLGVLLSHVAGPGGRMLKCCSIRVQLPDGHTLMVEDRKEDFELAAERAANRVDRLLRQAGRRRVAGLSHKAHRMEKPSWTS